MIGLRDSCACNGVMLGVPKPGCFKPGCLQFLHGSALLRSFAPFCALLRSCVCALLRSFACFCVRPRLERQRLGTADGVELLRRVAGQVVVEKGRVFDSEYHMTGRRLHHTMEVITASPGSLEALLLSRPCKVSIEQGDELCEVRCDFPPFISIVRRPVCPIISGMEILAAGGEH